MIRRRRSFPMIVAAMVMINVGGAASVRSATPPSRTTWPNQRRATKRPAAPLAIPVAATTQPPKAAADQGLAQDLPLARPAVPDFSPRPSLQPLEIPLGPEQRQPLKPRVVEPPNRTPESGRIPYVQEETPGMPMPDRESGGPAPPNPLVLIEILDSVERFFPLLIAVEQQRPLAEGQILTALGAYDLKIVSDAINNRIGFYQYGRTSALLEQQLAAGGVKVSAGYRRGTGFFPTWYGNRESYGGGAFMGGLTVPLLRDRAIDKYRADLRKSVIQRATAEPEILKARIEFLRAASVSYWDWVAAGQAYAISMSLLRVAELRDAALVRRIEEGALEGIERVDNQRLIVERRSKLVLAQRKLQQAAIKLSMFYRTDDGLPQLPDTARLPEQFPEAEATEKHRVPDDLNFAIARRPELVKIRLHREKTNVDLAQSRNLFLPSLDVGAYGTQNFGPPNDKRDKGPFALEAGLYFEMPLQRRMARGEIQQRMVQLTQIAQEERFSRDKIIMEIQDALTAIEAAYRRIGLARETIGLARTMEKAERTKLFLGDSNILFVNLREIATFDAALLEVDALAEYFKSLADYRAALAVDADFEPPPSPLLPPQPPPPYINPHLFRNIMNPVPQEPVAPLFVPTAEGAQEKKSPVEGVPPGPGRDVNPPTPLPPVSQSLTGAAIR